MRKRYLILIAAALMAACTPITPEELKYCYNDVKIICCYIDEQRKIYGNIAKIPLTNTGRVRKFVRDNCFHTVKNPKTGKKSIPYKNLTEKLFKNTKK